MRLKPLQFSTAGVLFCLFAIAGCGDPRTAATDDATDTAAAAAGPSAEPVEPVDAASASASDEYGPFSSPVTGVALWAHPKLSFEGLLFAASDDGLVSYNIEDGVEIARDDGFRADGVFIAYEGDGADAEAVIASRDAGTGQFRFYTIDNETRLPSLRPAMMVTDAKVDGYCLGKALGVAGAAQGLQLVSLSGNSFTRYELKFTAAGVSAARADAATAPEPIAACAVDDIDGSIFLASETGAIFRSQEGQPPAAFASAPAGSVAGLGAVFNQQDQGGVLQGQIALLDGANGNVHLFDRKDGHALGVVTIGASFDVDAVKTATALGVGYGNYGAVYRNGVLALATNSDTPSIRLISWNGVLNALGQPETVTANPRALHPEADDGLIIDIEVIDP